MVCSPVLQPSVLSSDSVTATAKFRDAQILQLPQPQPLFLPPQPTRAPRHPGPLTGDGGTVSSRYSERAGILSQFGSRRERGCEAAGDGFGKPAAPPPYTRSLNSAFQPARREWPTQRYQEASRQPATGPAPDKLLRRSPFHAAGLPRVCSNCASPAPVMAPQVGS